MADTKIIIYNINNEIGYLIHIITSFISVFIYLLLINLFNYTLYYCCYNWSKIYISRKINKKKIKNKK